MRLLKRLLLPVLRHCIWGRERQHLLDWLRLRVVRHLRVLVRLSGRLLLTRGCGQRGHSLLHRRCWLLLGGCQHILQHTRGAWGAASLPQKRLLSSALTARRRRQPKCVDLLARKSSTRPLRSSPSA